MNIIKVGIKVEVQNCGVPSLGPLLLVALIESIRRSKKRLYDQESDSSTQLDAEQNGNNNICADCMTNVCQLFANNSGGCVQSSQ